jgi:hypothetical protein
MPPKEIHLHVNNTGMDPAWSCRGLLCLSSGAEFRVVSLMCAAHPSTYCIWIVIVVPSLLIIMLLLKLLYLICLCYFLLYHEKAPPAHPPARVRGGARPLSKSATCNTISDKRQCDLKRSHREIVTMDHSLHFLHNLYFYFLSNFFHFSSIKSMLYCKESVSRTECWPCSIMSLFYLASYGMLDQCCHWQWLLVHVL